MHTYSGLRGAHSIRLSMLTQLQACNQFVSLVADRKKNEVYETEKALVWIYASEVVFRDRPIFGFYWYIGIGLNRSWQNAVIFLTHPDNLRKKAQRSKVKTVIFYNNASRCGFINKQTRLTMEHASAVAAETKASSGSFAMLEATTCRCCVRITPVILREVFAARNVLPVLKVQKSNRCLVLRRLILKSLHEKWIALC